MANSKINQLTTTSIVSNTDLAIVGDPSSGLMKQTTISVLAPRNIEVALTDTSTVAWDYANGNISHVTLGGDRTLSLANVPPVSFGLIKITQDNTGSRTLTLPSGSVTTASFGLSTAPGTTDIAGFYYDGSIYFWSLDKGYSTSTTTTTSTSTTTSSTTTTTTTGSGPSLTDITFSTGNGLSTPLSGEWTGSTGAFGVGNISLASSTSGYAQMDYVDSTAAGIVIGLTLSGTPIFFQDGGALAQYNYAVFVSGGVLFAHAIGESGGNYINTGVSIANGNKMRLSRSGSTVTADKSTDGGSNWTTAHTFTTTTTAQLFVQLSIATSSNICYNPKGSNLT